jgi:hypothetical protein
MTSLAFTSHSPVFPSHIFVSLNRQPRRSFAARLADLQARAEAATMPNAAAIAIRATLAAIPFGALAWMFVAV